MRMRDSRADRASYSDVWWVSTLALVAMVVCAAGGCPFTAEFMGTGTGQIAGEVVVQEAELACADLRFVVEPTDGPPDLTVQGHVHSVTGEPLPEGVYEWKLAGVAEEDLVTGDPGMAHTLSTGGAHVVSLTLAVAGLTIPIGCATESGEVADQATVTVWPTLSGHVIDVSGSPLANVVISVDGTELSTTTEVSGAFALCVPYRSSGVLRAARAGYQFAPEAWSFANVDRDIANLDFTAAGAGDTVLISGSVTTESGTAVGGVTLTASHGGGSTVTDARGFYVLGVDAGWSGTVTPSDGTHSFEPVSRDYESVQESLNGEDFVVVPGMGEEILPGGDEQISSDTAAGGLVTAGVTAPDDDSAACGGIDTTEDTLEGPVGFIPTISGTVHRPATVGVDLPIGPVALEFVGTGTAAAFDEIVFTDVDGTYCIAVSTGWTGLVVAADETKCTLLPEVVEFSTPVTESLTGQDLVAWCAPLGVPAPPFGIKETHWMYADATYDFGSGPEPYRDAGHGPYTHYVDNTHPAATDTDNPYGTAEQPRLRIPYPLAAGSVVEVHGGPYSYHIHTDNFAYGGDRLPLVGNGTAESPIFVRGVGVDDMPVFSGSTKPVRPEGCYIIMENLDLQRWMDIRPKTDMADPIHHVVLRHCDLHDFESTAVHIGWLHGLDGHPEWRDPTLVTDVVLYDNRIYNLGDWEQTGSSEDHAGVFPHINTLRLWILDNEIYHVDGDGIQINTWGIYDDPDIHLPPRLVYIGRNAVYECQENDLDFKVCQDVIVSQNAIYGIHDHSASSDGTAVVVHEDSGTATFPRPERLWYLFNEIYDNDIGCRIQDSEDVYVIGNTFHDMISSYALLDSGYSSGAAIQCWDNGTIHVVNNTIYNCDLGILSANNNGMLRIVNNVIADLSDSFLATFGTPAYHIFINVAAVADASEMHHNLLHQTGGSIRIRWDGIYTTVAAFQAGTGQGAGCLEADSQFIAASEGDFHLAPTSPVIDAGTVYAAYQTFLDLYGISIDVDCEGVARPAPPTDIWDLGAFERTQD